MGIEPQRSPGHPLQDTHVNTRRITKIEIVKITISYISMYLNCIGKNMIGGGAVPTFNFREVCDFLQVI